jgi:hypothetical protein
LRVDQHDVEPFDRTRPPRIAHGQLDLRARRELGWRRGEHQTLIAEAQRHSGEGQRAVARVLQAQRALRTAQHQGRRGCHAQAAELRGGQPRRLRRHAYLCRGDLVIERRRMLTVGARDQADALAWQRRNVRRGEGAARVRADLNRWILAVQVDDPEARAGVDGARLRRPNQHAGTVRHVRGLDRVAYEIAVIRGR